MVYGMEMLSLAKAGCTAKNSSIKVNAVKAVFRIFVSLLGGFGGYCLAAEAFEHFD